MYISLISDSRIREVGMADFALLFPPLPPHLPLPGRAGQDKPYISFFNVWHGGLGNVHCHPCRPGICFSWRCSHRQFLFRSTTFEFLHNHKQFLHSFTPPVLRQKNSPSRGWWFQLNVSLRPTAFIQFLNKELSFREVSRLF